MQQIIELTKQDQDNTALKGEIDQMVYALYGLTIGSPHKTVLTVYF